MKEKISKSLAIIRDNLAKYSKPVIWSSFGKDSLVLMDLVRKVDKNIPILFQKEYICPDKYAHSERLARENNLMVYSFPPMNTALQYHTYDDGSLEWEVQNFYTYQNGTNFTIPTGIVDNPSSDVCCLNDIYRKPFAIVNYMWDMQFIGHKDCDTDAFYESMVLDDYVYKPDDLPACVFPLKDWSDEDIWQYLDENNIDFNDKRYVRSGENWRGQYKNTTFNPDYFECCLECMKFNTSEKVYCPRLKEEIPNISGVVRYDNAPGLQYLQGANNAERCI